MALTLTAAMTAGLTACGGGGNSTSADGKKRYFKADYLSDLPDSFNDTTSNIQFKGDVMYYTSSNEDYTKSGLYSYNLITGENAQLYEQAQRKQQLGVRIYRGRQRRGLPVCDEEPDG